MYARHFFHLKQIQMRHTLLFGPVCVASKESPNQAYANSLFRFSYHCVRTLELSEANTRYGIRRTIKKCIFACTDRQYFSFNLVPDT